MYYQKHTSSNEYLNHGSWYEMYELTKLWQSDLVFYRDDLLFLHLLLDKYFVWLVKPEYLKIIQDLQNTLMDLCSDSKKLMGKVNKDNIQLGYLVENPNKGDAGIIKMDHEQLEVEISEFVKFFRKNRRELFSITDYIIESEELSSKIGA